VPFPEIDPVAFAIGPLVVRWYALAYIVGIGLGWFYGTRLIARKSLWPADTPPLTREQWLDFLFWAVIGIIVGGRLGYVIFYNPAYFAANLAEIPMLWAGGMSFHGGLLGMIIAITWFARRHKAPLLPLLDLLGAAAPIGLFFGRIANFINGELFGRRTDLPWGIVFPMGGPEPRHPSQLYEAALEGLLLFVLFFILIRFFAALKRPGLIAGLFGIGYGLSRILVEMVREPDAHIGYLPLGLTMGMVLSLPVLIAGIGLVAYALRKPAGRAGAEG
jgi:phosphatidylglycerol:prolipoprotein diacylglycerol transferase